MNSPGPGGDRWSELLPGASSSLALFLKSEHVRDAHGETRDEQMVAAHDRDATLQQVVDRLLTRLGESSPEGELTRQQPDSPVSLPLPTIQFTPSNSS